MLDKDSKLCYTVISTVENGVFYYGTKQTCTL